MKLNITGLLTIYILIPSLRYFLLGFGYTLILIVGPVLKNF